MNTALLLVILVLQTFAIYYLIRTARNLGNKATKQHKELMSNINLLRAGDGNNLLNHLNVPNNAAFSEVSWDHVISLTSYPARFETLSKSIEMLLSQRLIAKKIYVNIAETDLHQLPNTLKAYESSGIVQINSCTDIGHGKKLIQTLKLENSLPIIVVDDDLIFETDLTLKLMIQHHLTPGSVIASRVHKIKYEADGRISLYKNWQKNFSLSDGPSSDLFPTSGAGTLYKADFFHQDVVDETAYKQYAMFTDDLWWYIQSLRKGTLTKRLPGLNHLNFIDGTQEVGLWKNGNQDRNDPNLESLLKKYSI